MLVPHTLRRSGALAVAASLAAIASSVAGASGEHARNGKLAYTAVVGAFQIFVQHPDEDSARRVFATDSVDYQAVASPDGTRIAFVSGRDGNDEIYVANIDGQICDG